MAQAPIKTLGESKPKNEAEDEVRATPALAVIGKSPDGGDILEDGSIVDPSSD